MGPVRKEKESEHEQKGGLMLLSQKMPVLYSTTQLQKCF